MKKYLFLLVMMFLLVGSRGSFAYFTTSIGISGTDGNPLKSFTITNGEVSLEVKERGWTTHSSQTTNDIAATTISNVINPVSGQTASYEVWLNNTSNLTTNVDMNFYLSGTKIGGTTENPEKNPEDEETTRPSDNLATAFEVLVGDKDNLNFNSGSVSLDIYPTETDAQGTDRRMVTSGFYNYYQELSKKSNEPNAITINVFFESGAPTLDYIHYFDALDSDGNPIQGTDWNNLQQESVESRGDLADSFQQLLEDNEVDEESIDSSCLLDSDIMENVEDASLSEVALDDEELESSTEETILVDEVIEQINEVDATSHVKAFNGPQMNKDGNKYTYTFEGVKQVSLVLRNQAGNQQTLNINSLTPGEYTYVIRNSCSGNPCKYSVENSYQKFSYYRVDGSWVPGSRPGLDPKTTFYSLLSFNQLIGGWKHNVYDGGGVPSNNSNFGKLTENNGEIFFDGLVERAITRTNTGGGEVNESHVNGGRDWVDLQPIESLVFNYTNEDVISGKNVGSAYLQLKINDIQPTPTEATWLDKKTDWNWHTSFSPKSRANYQVTLTLKNSHGVIKTESVPEWETIINNLNQHNLVSDTVTLRFPVRLLDYIKQASQDGVVMELLIDDPNYGTDGDAYAIDYAELFVNKEIEMTGKITGSVYEAGTNNPIKGIIVTDLSTGMSVQTDEKGYFEFEKNIAGQVVLSLTHPSYQDREYTVQDSTSNSTNLRIEMVKGESDDIAEREKFTGTIKIERLVGSESIVEKEIPFTIKSTCPIIDDKKTCDPVNHESLVLNPDENYKITYTVNLKSADEIDPYANDFTLTFDSKFDIQLTQENNPTYSQGLQ